MKSLNGYTPEYIKQVISERFDVDVENIRLFGSRIRGDYGEYSDLDVAIIGKECPDEYHGMGLVLGGMEIELHWLEEYEDGYSWLVGLYENK